MGRILNTSAEVLNDLGNRFENRKRHALGKLFYRLAATACPRWSSPWYNLGLQAKYLRRWPESAECNRRAAGLAPDDEASWWNLAIAATALRDWQEAARAWGKIGINVETTSEGVLGYSAEACVRLNPEADGEVVWGTRIDPARIRIQNVPLPNSRRRYRDIVLNDGASEGTRISRGEDYPVFNELDLWRASAYSTFQSALEYENEDAHAELMEICADSDIGAENWGTVRILCAACSQGSPAENRCTANETAVGTRNYGFGAIARETLDNVLTEWAARGSARAYSEPHLVLLAQQ